MHSSQQRTDPDHEPPRESMGFFFRAAIVLGAAFVITILGLVSLVYSDPQAPPVRFLHAYGGHMIAAEVVLLLAAVLGGMIQDRPRSGPSAPSTRHAGSQPNSPSQSAGDAP